MYKRVSLNISKYFFLVLFLGFSAGITFFNHSHVIDGYTIVHSHPFSGSGSGIPGHNHSANGLLLIHLLADFSAMVPAVILFHDPLLILIRKLPHTSCPEFFNLNYLIPNSLRGPPRIMLSLCF